MQCEKHDDKGVPASHKCKRSLRKGLLEVILPPAWRIEGEELAGWKSEGRAFQVQGSSVLQEHSSMCGNMRQLVLGGGCSARGADAPGEAASAASFT